MLFTGRGKGIQKKLHECIIYNIMPTWDVKINLLILTFLEGIHNMRKLLISLLAVSSTASFAVANNSEFQEFINEANIGFGMNQTTASYGSAAGAPGNLVSTGNQVTLEAERLFNSGVYVEAIANGQFGAGPAGNPQNTPSYGLNGKVGYAFSLANQHLLLTPYALVGMNNNSSTMINEIASLLPGSSSATANQFYYTGGVGGRLEYRINRTIDLYADQNVAMNWDQTGLPFGIQPQNFVSYTSTLGARFNLAPNFQLGVKGFYTGYDNQASNTIGGVPAFAQNNSTIGGLVTLGLLY